MPVALLTDFGTKDHFVGAMKGVILGINPNAAIVDITHEVEPHDIRSAAFLFAACFRDFPVGSVFLCVVDPGVGSKRRAIVAEFSERYFVGPDNGLVSFAFADDETCRVFEIANERFIRQNPSSTFHGRDIFAPAAAHLSMGVQPQEFGPPVKDPVRLNISVPRPENGVIVGEVIYVDRFGNLITNLTRSHLPDGSSIGIAGRKIAKFATHYAEMEKGELAVIEGSAGFIEISANMASAAEILRIGVGSKLQVET